MTLIAVLPASIPSARAQSPLATKCNAVGNFSLDDRIAGCTALIETTTGIQQSVIFAHFRRAGFYLDKGEVDRAPRSPITRGPSNSIQRMSTHIWDGLAPTRPTETLMARSPTMAGSF
jgi:hypothetical protein